MRVIFQNSFQSVNINLKTLISYLFISRDFLTQFPLWCYALSSFFVHQSEHRLPFPAKHWIPQVDTDGTWCLSFFAFSLTGKNCLTPVWEEVVELCPCGKRSTQVINGLIFLKEKSLSRSDIGYYKTRQASKKFTYLVAIIRKGEDKGFREKQFLQGLKVIWSWKLLSLCLFF